MAELLGSGMSMECTNCGHVYEESHDHNIYICPACDAGPPSTHTIYPFVDKTGRTISHRCVPRLRELGKIPQDITRDELLERIRSDVAFETRPDSDANSEEKIHGRDEETYVVSSPCYPFARR